MVECKYCDEEFESKEDLHLHWGDEHEEELSSHDKEKVKKAERKQEEKKQAKMNRRKKLAGQGLAIGGALIVVAVLGYQAMNTMGGSNVTGEFDLEGEPYLGSSSANVTVVEFGDYKCPYCKQFEQRTFPKLEENYVETGQIKFYFMNYDFLGQSSTRAAVAGECVINQDEGQFWNFHKALYENQGAESQDWATQERLMDIANQSTEGLDYNQLEQCIANEETLSEVRSDKQQGTSNGVTGTPSVYVNGEKLSRTSYSSIRAAIEQELN